MSNMMMSKWVFFAILVSAVVSLRNPNGETQNANLSPSASPTSIDSGISIDFFTGIEGGALNLEYNFYEETCPIARQIISSTMRRIVMEENRAPAQLLRLLFHDCFIEGCDASVLLLDNTNGSKNQSVERDAIPNKTLKGFNYIDTIKEELEKVCPGVVSCADLVVLATRDAIVLVGGPFYPVLTGRRDSERSFFERALAEIPRPDGNITETLRLFGQRGFSERETVALLGAHNIGKIGCEFIQPRLNNFSGTGQPDGTINFDFIDEVRANCEDSAGNNNSSGSSGGAPSPKTSTSRASGSSGGAPSPMTSTWRAIMSKESSINGMSYYQELLSSSISSGLGFDSHYYQSLLRGRGLLFADQQLLANEKTAEAARMYASDAALFRQDFARAMVKLSNLGVLTGSEGQVRFNCSLATVSPKSV